MKSTSSRDTGFAGPFSAPTKRARADTSAAASTAPAPLSSGAGGERPGLHEDAVAFGSSMSIRSKPPPRNNGLPDTMAGAGRSRKLAEGAREP